MSVARERLLALASDPPADVAMRVALCESLLAAGETALCHACLPDETRALRVDAGTRVHVAHVCHRLGDTATALTWMQSAIGAVQPHPAHAHFHALLLQFVGHLEQAECVLDDCLRQWPHFGSAALTRSRLRRQSATRNHVDYLRAQACDTSPDELSHASFLFALFKELDDLDEYDAAWASLAQANAIMHRRNPYDEAADQAIVDATMQYVDGRTPHTCVSTPHDGPCPIFIVGMPRSGTTLLERLLGNHSRITAAGELTDFFRQWCHVTGMDASDAQDCLRAIRQWCEVDYRELGGRYLQQTAWRANGRAFFIDKMPNNFQFVGMIRDALPAAKVINVVRRPMAMCFSNFTAMLGDASPHVYEQGALARFERRHERLRQHWHRVVPGAMLDVAYEDLVTHPEMVLRAVLRHCGLDFEPACLDPTLNHAPSATPSSAQVREPINQRGIAAWRPYARHLQPLSDALGQ